MSRKKQKVFNQELPEAAKTHNLWYVKRNDGSVIRMALFTDLLRGVRAKRAEVELRGLGKDELDNPMWQTDRIIWWNPLHDVWYEATQDDDLAKMEYRIVKEKIKDYPDDEVDQVYIMVFDDKHKFKMVEGSFRRTG